MDFQEAISTVINVLQKNGTVINADDFDGLIVKRLASSNTLDEGRRTNQTHIAITGEQMDIFPNLSADGYFYDDGTIVNDDLKKYFVLKVSVLLNRKNCEYLGINNLMSSDAYIQTDMCIYRSKRANQSDQLQLSLLNYDGDDFKEFRKHLHKDDYFILLKYCSSMRYLACGIKNGADGSYELSLLNNRFFRASRAMTVVNADSFISEPDRVDDFYLNNDGDNEQLFRSWMTTQKTSRGTAPAQSTINNNCDALRRVCRLIDITEYPDLENLFDVSDPAIFADIKEIIKSQPNYEEVNVACSNRSLSTALRWYEKFLIEQAERSEELAVEENATPYTKEDFLNDVFIDSSEYDKLKRLLFYKRNIILQGAPGVGKTFLAKRFAYSIIGEKNENLVEEIQFHQNYSYEDFIMGYKPTDDSFELKPGIFYDFCKKADKDPDRKYFFIIDEINRGNLSKIFGELMMLIEGDKRGEDNSVTLAYKKEKFFVPKNIYLIGMMNTADRSLAMIDYALRRRFSFYSVKPAFENDKFKSYLNSIIGDTSIANKVIDRLTDLNKKIADEDNSGLGEGFCVGHSYFCIKPVAGQSDSEWYKTIIEYEIAPLLQEYWWDDKSKAEDCIRELLR